MGDSHLTNSHANPVSPWESCLLPEPARCPQRYHRLMRLRYKVGCLQGGSKNQTRMAAASAGYLRLQSQTNLAIAQVTSAQCPRSPETASTPTSIPSNRTGVRHRIVLTRRGRTIDISHITRRYSPMKLSSTGRFPLGIICHEWMKRSNLKLCLRIILPFLGHGLQMPSSHV